MPGHTRAHDVFSKWSEIDCLAWILVKWFHLFSAFGAKDGGHVVFVHDRFTRQIDEEKTVLVAVAGIAVAVKPIIAGTFLGYPMAIASWVCCTEGRIWWPDCYRPSPIPEPVRERRALCPHGCNFRCCSRILST